MSLFEQAQKIVSDILEERKEPMLSVSMERMQPVMPMAQGGGLSTVQNSLNINGQPHRLAYINPSEENLLTQLGGSGRKIDGIPAYFDPGDDSDPGSGDTTGGFGDSDPGSAEEGIGIGFGTTPAEAEAAVNAAQAEEAAVAAAIGEQAAYGDKGSQAFGLGFGKSSGAPGVESPKAFYARENLNRQDYKDPTFKGNLNKNKALGLISIPAMLAKTVFDMVKGDKGYGLDPMGVVGEIGSDPDDNGPDADTGTNAGGDDIIIRQKIAAVKQVPIEEVTAAEVQRAKQLTNAQRVAGTKLEDILDDIYGSGEGAGLLGITTNNTGTS